MSQVNDEDAGVLEEREEFDDQAEFVDEDDTDDDADVDEEGEEFGDDLDDYDEDIEAVDAELSLKEQNARSLAIRRAIEQRLERKRLDEDLDYLDLDFDE